ncbi:MAG TPA: TetR/AcrR family transcriptional regulator [Tepidisphaeraceae bacterium]|nr:TetR/AcrR family transcriptional regulator [Tepidisphaeraceae bacterium]
MQVPNERKRKLITDAAARLFATRAFHKVRLEDIAAEARVGKGTLYVYFQSKEDLYFALIYDGFAAMVERLKTLLAGDRQSAREALRAIVRELVAFAFRHPHYFELTRTVGKVRGRSESAWGRKRHELTDLIEQTLRRGVRLREFADPRPELTAMYVPGFVRALLAYGAGGLDENQVAGHIIRLLELGIIPRKAS